MKSKAFISQTMNGVPEEQIKLVRERATKSLESMGYEVVDSYFEDLKVPKTVEGDDNIGLYYLAKSIEKMSECKAVYLCKGWENARGCQIEHLIAKSYGLTIYQG